jgi:hypothetical protein
MLGAYLYRLIAAALLDPSVYEGIEVDRHANAQAVATVLLSSLAAGIGAGGWYGPRPVTLMLVALIAMACWVAWAMLTFQIGTRMLPTRDTQATLGELLRTIGFAAAPGLLQVFAVLPRMTVPVFVATWLWMFAAMVIAVQHALDYPRTRRAVAVCALAAGLVLVLAVGLGVLLAPTVS